MLLEDVLSFHHAAESLTEAVQVEIAENPIMRYISTKYWASAAKWRVID
jgi:hypothetical protein